MIVNILFHDNCFDGASSAAVFHRFYQEKISAKAEFSLQGMTHQAGQQFHDAVFNGDENAIVDFKYASTDRLTWWFDHHYSAFLTPEDEQHFLRDRSGKKFYDPTFKSCTKLIATVTFRQFGFECPMLDELVHWADIIDGAQYPDAETAVEVREPAQKLAAVIEANKEPAFLYQIIYQLAQEPLWQVAAQKTVAERYALLDQRHSQSIEIIRDNSHFDGEVTFFDLSQFDLEGYNKFIPYYLYPEANYSVSLLRTAKRMKVSVGWNPWSPKERKHNLAKICERYGGGGHPVVAAISFNLDAVEKARLIAKEIVAELKNEHHTPRT
jgi:hypothetical protein